MWSFLKGAAKGVFNNIVKPAIGEFLGVSANAITDPGVSSQQYLGQIASMGKNVLGNIVSNVGRDVIGNTLSNLSGRQYQPQPY